MKKPQFPLLILITAIFAAFTLGFFLGRNANHTPVQLSIPETKSTAPVQTLSSDPQGSMDTVSQSPATHSTEPSLEITEPLPSSPSSPVYLSDKEPVTEGTEAANPVSSDGRININTASHGELMTLPGIGEVIAQRIIDYRNSYGPFPTAESLKNVSGIGQKRLDAIIDLITVGG